MIIKIGKFSYNIDQFRIIRGAFFVVFTGPRSRSILNEANYARKSKWRPPLVFLKKLRLGHLTELFHRENNTSDIISMLSTHEMDQLG